MRDKIGWWRRVVVLVAVAAALVTTAAAPSSAQSEGEGEGPLPEQPDLTISKNGRTYIGDDVYNTTGAGQTMSRNAARGTTVRFFVEFEQDGDDNVVGADTVRGCAGNNNFGVRYFGVSPGGPAIDLTSLITAGFNNSINGLIPDLAVEVKVKRNAPAGATLNCKVKATTVDGATTLRDTVLMTVRRS